jgi:hypothetical protein
MEHFVINSAKFNYLKIEHAKDGMIMSGETKEGLDNNDTVQNPFYDKQFLPIKEVLERRDSVDFPKGNNYFFRILL